MSLPESYKATVIAEFSPDFRTASRVVELKTADLQAKIAEKTDHVLVKIHHTTTRASDRNDSNGRYGAFDGLPFVAGYEAVGRVLEVGKDVKRVKVGDAVGMLLFKRGGAAEYNAVPESECFPLPATLPDFITFFNAGLTALCGLTQSGGAAMRIKPESAMAKYFPENVDTSEPYKPEFVVVTAAAGGVGVMACQFALAAGNEVLGLAGSDDKLEAIKKLGVQHAVNYKSFSSPAEMAKKIRQMAGRDVDVVWETVGGETLVALSSIVGDKGRLCVIGQISGGYGTDADAKQRQANLGKPAVPLGASVLSAPNPARDAAIANLTAQNAKMGAYFMSITTGDAFDTFGRYVEAEVGLWESKAIRAVTDDTQKFVGVEHYVDGVEYLHKGHNIGKVVIKCHAESETA